MKEKEIKKRFNSYIFLAIILFYLDLLTSYIGLKNGFIELNPIINFLFLTYGIFLTITIKLIMSLYVIFIIYISKEKIKTEKQFFKYRFCIFVLTFFYILIIYNNFLVLLV